ncbi:MAG: PocR ligand-binding domain-containing protein [Treponema sp.]|nr:PocR ligand-binding domain-containing protein [Treponema sp.]
MKEQLTSDVKNTTIIERREIKPLLIKACKMMSFYEKAVGCPALVIDKSGASIPSIEKRQTSFCEVCSNSFPRETENWTEDDHPCILKHREALANARRGGVYIYTCEAGLSYWTSPLYAGGRYAGSIAAGQVLTVSQKEIIERCNTNSRLPPQKIQDMLSKVPMKSNDEVQAMAKLLMLCAKKISGNPWDQTSVSRKKTSGKIIFKPKQASGENPGRLNFQEKEKALLAALRRGDKHTVSQILGEIIKIIEKAGQDEFDFFRLHSIELSVLISREAGKNFKLDEAYNRCIKRIKESQTVQELSENLAGAINQLGVKVFSYQGICHALALRKAEKFIWENYSRKISLEEIAAVSGLSAPYFSTIFKKELGINLCDYLNRLRIDMATSLLAETDTSLAEIAKLCGYDDQSWFSKVFKSRLGISPGKYREQGK